MPSIEEKRERLLHKTWMLMIKIAFIFGIPAAIAFFVGRYIDTRFDMRPNGTLMVLGLSFVLSWAITIHEYKKINKQFRALRQEEEEQQDNTPGEGITE